VSLFLLLRDGCLVLSRDVIVVTSQKIARVVKNFPREIYNVSENSARREIFPARHLERRRKLAGKHRTTREKTEKTIAVNFGKKLSVGLGQFSNCKPVGVTFPQARVGGCPDSTGAWREGDVWDLFLLLVVL